MAWQNWTRGRYLLDRAKLSGSDQLSGFDHQPNLSDWSKASRGHWSLKTDHPSTPGSTNCILRTDLWFPKRAIFRPVVLVFQSLRSSNGGFAKVPMFDLKGAHLKQNSEKNWWLADLELCKLKLFSVVWSCHDLQCMVAKITRVNWILLKCLGTIGCSVMVALIFYSRQTILIQVKILL